MPSDVEQGSDPRGTPMDGTLSMEDVKEQTVEVADLKAQQVSPKNVFGKRFLFTAVLPPATWRDNTQPLRDRKKSSPRTLRRPAPS